MTAARRWCLVGLGIVVVLALPAAVGALPAQDSDLTAPALLHRVQDSGEVPYSGYAESVGGLQLPVTDQFTDLIDLLGERARMRVWWRSTDDWRVDSINATGETDLVHDFAGTTTWDFEAALASRTRDADVRLPRTTDLLPTLLGQRLLSEASPQEVSRLPAARIAGREAPGLRLVPSDPRSTVDHVDAWVDVQTGLPLRVSVFGGGARTPAVTTSFLDLSTDVPAATDTAFSLPPGATARFDEVVDVAAAADRFAPVVPPDQLAGLDRRTEANGLGAVGEYGRGVTLLVAVPLWDQIASPLREQLAGTPGAKIDEAGTTVAVGPLTLLLTPEIRRGGRQDTSWLLAGTVTADTLAAAGAELVDNPQVQR